MFSKHFTNTYAFNQQMHTNIIMLTIIFLKALDSCMFRTSQVEKSTLFLYETITKQYFTFCVCGRIGETYGKD